MPHSEALACVFFPGLTPRASINHFIPFLAESALLCRHFYEQNLQNPRARIQRSRDAPRSYRGGLPRMASTSTPSPVSCLFAHSLFAFSLNDSV